MENVEFAKEIKAISLVKSYVLGKISFGLASKMLELSRTDFPEYLKGIMFHILIKALRTNCLMI